MSEYTKRPWSVPHFARPDVGCKCGYVLVDGFCGAVASVHFSTDRELEHGDNPPFDEAIANAYLIAASPELLEEVKSAAQGYDWFKDEMTNFLLYGGAWTIEQMHNWGVSIASHIRSRKIGTSAAIAKATGEPK